MAKLGPKWLNKVLKWLGRNCQNRVKLSKQKIYVSMNKQLKKIFLHFQPKTVKNSPKSLYKTQTSQRVHGSCDQRCYTCNLDVIMRLVLIILLNKLNNLTCWLSCFTCITGWIIRRMFSMVLMIYMLKGTLSSSKNFWYVVEGAYVTLRMYMIFFHYHLLMP